jgi:glycosyltransferase involved in cell wall biosynthesis
MTKFSPLVSVILPVFNPDPVYFPLAVRSVLDQTYSNFELIIIEDKSSRSASDFLVKIHDGRIKHFCHPHRRSLVEAFNSGLDMANSEYIARFDADDVCFPRRLESQIRFMAQNPHIAVCGGQIEVIDQNGMSIGFRQYPITNREALHVLRRSSPIANPSAMMRKSAVLAVGGYRIHYAEDYDLWCRMAEADYGIANLPEILIRYRIHPAGFKSDKTRALLRSTISIKKKYFGNTLSFREKMRIYLEWALLFLPPSVVLRLFLLVNVRRYPPKYVRDLTEVRES